MAAKSEKILNFWFPVFIYSGIIFCVSAVPNLKGPGAELNLDKLYHFIEYIPFGFLAARALNNSLGLTKTSNWFWAIALVSLYAVTDEFHQSFVPGRSCDWHDWLADTIGGMTGAGVYITQVVGKIQRHRST